MTKNIVICLDGTNNQLRAAANTNVVRLFAMLDPSDPEKQVAYYDPGVGTFSSPAAWTPVARKVSRIAGLMFGVGLRHNLGEAYCFLMSVYEPGDRIFVFGFSRGAYTARALTGMLEVFGIFRRGSENLVPYAVNEYAKQDKRKGKRDWKVLREYARIHGQDMGDGRRGHAEVHFVGLWDTVKAAGHLWRQLRWPYTRKLPHASVVRHAVSIDERRRPFVEYLLERPDPDHLLVVDQDLAEVWFAGVHSDVGGMFEQGARLSDIPLKWMTEQAVAAGLLVRPHAYREASEVSLEQATGDVHTMNRVWKVLGTHTRTIPVGAAVHASVTARVAADPDYAKRLPSRYVIVDEGWLTPSRLPRRSNASAAVGDLTDEPVTTRRPPARRRSPKPTLP